MRIMVSSFFMRDTSLMCIVKKPLKSGIEGSETGSVFLDNFKYINLFENVPLIGQDAIDMT